MLGFLLDEDILLPPAAAGTVQNVTVKLSGIIGVGLSQLPGCTFQQPYTWYWNDPQPDQAMLDDIEAILNATTPPCVPNYFSTCPPPGKTEKNFPNGTAHYSWGVCQTGAPFICPIAVMTIDCKQPCPDWNISISDLQAMADNARQGALYWMNTKVIPDVVPCYGFNVAPAPFFDIGYNIQGWGSSSQVRYITVVYHYYGCGPCRGKSIKIKP